MKLISALVISQNIAHVYTPIIMLYQTQKPASAGFCVFVTYGRSVLPLLKARLLHIAISTLREVYVVPLGSTRTLWTFDDGTLCV